jgi:hypothetical protein
MNEHDSLKPKSRNQSAIYCGIKLGFCLGAALTFAILMLSVFNGNIAMSFGILVQRPMWKIVELFGQQNWLFSHHGVSWIQVFLAVALNGFLCSLVGAVIGCIIKVITKSRGG